MLLELMRFIENELAYGLPPFPVTRQQVARIRQILKPVWEPS